MNPDTLRKACEYADGWEVFDSSGLLRVRIYGMTDLPAIENMLTPFKDALAAQLVRQIDALDDYHVGTIQRGSSVHKNEWINKQHCYSCPASADGPDRTENTINACVQFYQDYPELLT